MFSTDDMPDLSQLPPEFQALFAAERQARIKAEAERDRLTVTAAEVIDLQAKNSWLENHVARLEHLLKESNQAQYGRRSEKLSPDERQLALEDLGIAIAESEAALEDAQNADGQQKSKPRDHKKPKRNRGNLPAHLPRIEQFIEPEITTCACGCDDLVKIGEDRSERLDVIPAQFRVLVTIRPKYACKSCHEGVHQAPAPARLIEGGIPTEALVAHILVSKFQDHLPLYRQADIYTRSGIELDRSTLSDWVGKAAFHLEPIADRLAEHLKSSGKLFMDETRAPVLDPGRGRTKTGYFWALARDDRRWSGSDPPGIVFTYAPGRGGGHAEQMLQGFNGILQVDGYKAYNRLVEPKRQGGKPLTLALCWAHARRQLRTVFDHNASPIAKEGLEQIAALYKIEDTIRGLGPEARKAIRQQHSKPLIDAFGKWLEAQISRVSRKARLGEKLAYIHRHWQGLCVFLDDGRVEMDSNAVENGIRKIVLTRKNALFAGHDEGGRAWGIIASLIGTANLNGVEPTSYLSQTLKAIANGHPQSRIDELLPWNFAPTSSP